MTNAIIEQNAIVCYCLMFIDMLVICKYNWLIVASGFLWGLYWKWLHDMFVASNFCFWNASNGKRHKKKNQINTKPNSNAIALQQEPTWIWNQIKSNEQRETHTLCVEKKKSRWKELKKQNSAA